MVRRATLAALLSLTSAVTSALLVPACARTPTRAPSRACGLRVWHRPASAAAHVEIVGDWDGWKRPGLQPEMQDDGWRVAAIDVTPGEHAYAIVEDGVWLTDRNEPMSGFYEGREVAVAIAPDCSSPELRVDRVETKLEGGEGIATVHATFIAAASGSKLTSIVAPSLRVVSADPESGAVVLEARGLLRGKYTFAIAGRDEAGVVSSEARAVAWIDRFSGGEPFAPRDAIVYQVVLDRFRDDRGPLAPPKTPASRAGGTLAGVRHAIESGELDALGVNTVWLSPLYTNPEGEFPGNDGRAYTSYHGYWPIDWRGIDRRFATEAELDAFMALAHSRGLRVLFDVVPNHVHEQHAWAKAHADWFDRGCLCGQGSCDWAANIQTCWFASYLPDLDWTQSAVARAATDEAMWWFDRWDADGIRIDAVPMMPRAATRRIATTVRRRYAHTGHTPYILGENFTGPGAYGVLRYDLGPFGLDGSFHFPLMWSLRDAIALETAPLSAIDQSFRAGEEAWDGSGAVMGLMIGNHDVARFASVSAGNADGDAWTSPPQPNDPLVYAKQRLALAAVFTLPGAPVLYYGDEVGLAGRSDPDCRRVMPDEATLLAAQIETRELARKVGRARACSRALRHGKLRTLVADAERLVFAREDEKSRDVAIVTLSRRPKAVATVRLPENTPPLVDAVTGAGALSPELTLPAEAFAVHVYLPESAGCE